MMGVPHDTCECGARKQVRSKRCQSCDGKRRRPHTKSKRRDSDLSWFPEKGRYGLLAVSGYADEAGGRWSTTFSVLDSHDEWREVKRLIVSGQRVHYKRLRLIRWIKGRNASERAAT